MYTERFEHLITSVEELMSLIGEPSELVIKKQLPELDIHMQNFIAASPFVLLGTFDEEGNCDVSPRGDAPPVARVLDPKTLVIPDRRGNRRADSLRNIIATGQIGLLFLIPGMGETLRVNGQACLVGDESLLQSLAIDGKVPQLAIAVEVEECFLQCAKAVIRSKLWESHAEKPVTSLPCFAQILVDQTKMEAGSVEALNAAIEDSYANKLY